MVCQNDKILTLIWRFHLRQQNDGEFRIQA
jgi:hypothetical protein